MAVRLFSRTGRNLRVVGSGPKMSNLKGMARANVEFHGRVSDTELRDLYARCRAFILPGEEDFGITSVEALASGKAVIALGRGGVLESAPPEGGIFFAEPEGEQLEEAIGRFEKMESRIISGNLQASVARFSEAEFAAKMSRVLTSRPCRTARRESCAGESSDTASASGCAPGTDPS